MEVRYKCVVFLLGVNLFFSVSIWATNISEVLDEQIKNASQIIEISTEKTAPFGFNNTSVYDASCDCGFWTTACSYIDGKKVCECWMKYEQNNKDECEQCDCGGFGNKCYFKDNKKKCSCLGKYKLDYLGNCEECDCGSGSESCELKGFSKVCSCKPEHVVLSGKCERCDCGEMSTSCDLTFDKYTRCQCLPGYVAERRGWETNEKCKLPGPSGWKIAIYIESIFFGSIILICVIMIFWNRKSS